MSTFEVRVVSLDDILPHPNADRIELAVIGGYQSIVPKDVYKKGDLAIYVPEGAVVPDEILEKEGLTGKLAGSKKNRVKAVRFRQVLSQGLTMPLRRYFPYDVMDTGADVAEQLGIFKYEPPVPVHMAGEIMNLTGLGGGISPLRYDIENYKRYPDVLQDDEQVVLTEKIHGTFIQVGWRADIEPNEELFGDGRVFICSKGLGGKGLVFKNNEKNKGNLYVRAAHQFGLVDLVMNCSNLSEQYIMGEVFGDGVQDLKYGHEAGSISFRAFESICKFSHRTELEYQPPTLVHLDCPAAPIVARGLWKDIRPKLQEYTRGNTTLCEGQIREGVVIRPLLERRDETLGRVILKSVSEDYLLRGGNTTELQ